MSQRRKVRTDDLRVEHSPGPAADDGRGRAADRPKEIPRAGWSDVLKRTKNEVKNDRVPLVAAGVAYYAMLALFPAITALVSLYGLVADPQTVQQQISAVTQGLPQGAADLISQQAQSVAQGSGDALTFGLVVSILAALWVASNGMHGMMQALTVANNEAETRGFIKRRAVALGLTLLALVLVILAVGAIVVVPIVMDVVGMGAVGEWAIRILRWPLMGAVVIAALAFVYRYGPDRDEAQWRWVSWGAVVATVLWIIASIGFSVYVSNFGSYDATYGTLGAAIVLLLWLFISSFIIILGAELNAEMEHQTAEDTTEGHPRPMGRRDAMVADHLGERQG